MLGVAKNDILKTSPQLHPTQNYKLNLKAVWLFEKLPHWI